MAHLRARLACPVATLTLRAVRHRVAPSIVAVRRGEAGFGIIELLLAMIFLNVALMVLVSAYSSATVSINRASRISNAGVVADSQMERFRGMSYAWIGLNTAAGTDAVYKADSACIGGGTCTNIAPDPNISAASCQAGGQVYTNFPQNCAPSQNKTGPDGKTYRVDTYVAANQTVSPGVGWSGHVTKLVTVVVRDPSAGNHVLAREESDFDNCTALPDPSGNGAPC